MLVEAGLRRRTESTDPFLARLDDFRYRHGFPTRVEAVRWLIQAALDQKLAPKAAEHRTQAILAKHRL
jgi:metal-responsive CopG/Arc/MetJ family transcriptional regulator